MATTSFSRSQRAHSTAPSSRRRDPTLPLMFGLFCLGLLLAGLGAFLYPSSGSSAEALSTLSVTSKTQELPGELRQWLEKPAVDKSRVPPVAGEVRQPRIQSQPKATAEGVDVEERGNSAQPLISMFGTPAIAGAAERTHLAQPPLGLVVSAAPAKPLPSWTEEQLMQQLRRMPTLGVTREAMRQGVAAAAKEMAAMSAPHPEAALLATVKHQPALAQVPFRRGVEARLEPQQAKDIDFLAPRLRAVIAACMMKVESQNPFDAKERINAKRLKAILTQGQMAQLESVDNNELRLKATLKTWRQPAAVSTLNQLLMAENTDVRLVLVELLGQIDGKESTAALAQRAVFDPAPKVRKAAVGMLQNRAREEVRPALLAGLRHPWLPANYHAAQALVALVDLEAVPALEQLLAEPDPRDPRLVEQNGEERYAVAEVVKVNHLKNCLLCHGPSLDARDVLRRAMPEKILDRRYSRWQNTTRLTESPVSGNGLLDERNDLQSGWVSTGPDPVTELRTTSYYNQHFDSAGLPITKPINGIIARVFPLQPRIISANGDNIFVQASQVLVQQDLSLQISSPYFTKEGIIANHDRFDYLVRNKPLTSEEYAERLMAMRRGTGRHEATRYALDVLTSHQPPEVHGRPATYHPEGKTRTDAEISGK